MTANQQSNASQTNAALQTMAGRIQTALAAHAAGDLKTAHKAMVDLGNDLVPVRHEFREGARAIKAATPKPVKAPKAPKVTAAAKQAPAAKPAAPKPSVQEQAAALAKQGMARARAAPKVPAAAPAPSA